MENQRLSQIQKETVQNTFCVAFKNEERQVGEVAKRQAITNPNTIMSVKRHMGTDYKVEIEGKEYTPQEISAIIFTKLKKLLLKHI